MSTVRSTSVLALLLLLGCGQSAQHASAVASPEGNPANGKAIFQTGVDLQGTHIVARPPALMPSCAACHHADGSGGVHLPGGAVSADLRYRSLVTGQTPPYTLALLERAISTGVDNTGQRLSPVMPRWQLSDADLRDVATYVLTSLK